MSKHTERAKELRSEVPVSSNCAQTVMRVYAKEIGLDEDLAAAIGSNFGGGMRCGAILWSDRSRIHGIRCQGN